MRSAIGISSIAVSGRYDVSGSSMSDFDAVLDDVAQQCAGCRFSDL
jgi:hypothetical protein